ncbi:MAG: PilZ domain-containing protein [Bdellovibrio sp.]|nr:PilZ domain-containing protein [Bdellovibrio sp.]
MPPKTDSTRTLVERPERFTLSGLHNVQFKIKLGEDRELKCRLINLSSYGLAFEINEPNYTFELDQKLQVEITLDNQVIPLVLNVRHLDAAVGCRIENADGRFRELVENFFINEIAAEQLVKVDSPITYAHVEGEFHKYVGSSNSFDLSYIEKNEKITQVDITLMGNTIKIDQQGQIEYGFLIEDENCNPGESIHIKVQDLPDEMINHALRFVWNVQAIPSNIKQTIMGMIENSRHKEIA